MATKTDTTAARELAEQIRARPDVQRDEPTLTMLDQLIALLS